MQFSRLADLGISRYVYGTTRLGDDSIPVEARRAILRSAIAAGAWIHTSNQYGDALNVIRSVFDEPLVKTPPAIFKLGWSSAEEVRGQVVDQLAVVGQPSMAIGQIFPGGALAEDLKNGGPEVDGLRQMKADGLVGNFIMEVWPWSSETALDVVRNGNADGVIDGLIFYLNPLQRMVTNEVWDLIREQNVPMIAMRTVSGGDVRTIKDNPNAPDYLRLRAAAVAPIFARSGIESWAEFAARYSLSFPQVVATVGATSRQANLDEFLAITRDPQPLPSETVEEIASLQREWSDSHDRHAAAWSM